MKADVFDIIVIGAGVVGCAVARRFVLEGARVAVVEKADDILDGASKANSAILHTGFDAPSGSVELACIREGYREYQKIHHDLGLPIDNCGAHVVAWNKDQEAGLQAIVDKAHSNGIGEVVQISKPELLGKEPNLDGSAIAAISVPGEAIIDPWSAPYAYLQQALANGGEIILDCEVRSGKFAAGEWKLDTSRGAIRGRHVINCAGLYGDLVNRSVLGESAFNIMPRKGQFVVFDKAAAKLISSVILPVPTSRTKGVVLFRTVFGNLAVGPTAEDQQSRCDASTDEGALQALISTGIEKLPALAHMPVTAVYAGLRPACEFKDYQIDAKPAQNWITVGAIRSTGLSGALGIARYVYDLYENTMSKPAHSALSKPVVPRAHVLAQNANRDWKQDNHGEIICHCELVSKREINKALEGPLAARSLAGLKRQTRVTMGRCQGFYCLARLAQLTNGHFKTPVSEEVNGG